MAMEFINSEIVLTLIGILLGLASGWLYSSVSRKRSDVDGSLSWQTRIFIYIISLMLAILAAIFFSESIASFIQRHNAFLSDSVYFPSAIFFTIVTIIFGFGHWIVKTHDIKRQSRDAFTQRNDQQLSRSIELVSRGDNSFAQCLGLRMLAKLKNNQNIDESYKGEIDLATCNLVIKGAYLPLANLEGVKLVNANFDDMDSAPANLTGINLHKADLCDSILRYADMRGANLSAAKLNGADLSRANLCGADLSDIEIDEKTLFSEAKYDYKTEFPVAFYPDEHGMEK